jgi:glycine/D-amino acid oxidase-like deaminating enzyme
MVTKPKDLRTGRTVWEGRRTPLPSIESLTRDIRTDILIVGAGITGAMAADALAEAGFEVAIADRRPPMSGATSASTALIQYEIDMPLTKLARRIGKGDAGRAWRRSRLALDALAARIQELKIPDVAQRDSLYLAGTQMDAKALQREAQARRAIGLETLYLERRALKARFGISREAALLGYGNLAADPRKLTSALLRRAQRGGARLYSPVEIKSVDSGKSVIVATTRAGQKIRCRRLVFATGYEFPKSVPMNGHKIASTWAFATVPQKARLWPGECLIWEASDPYLYLRSDPQGRVICGGEDEDFSDAQTRDALLVRKIDTLRRKLDRLLPGIDTTVAYAWTASFGESATGLPTIGEIPRMRNCWAALGYGGNGITYSRIAADILRASFTGASDPDADLYAFKRGR